MHRGDGAVGRGIDLPGSSWNGMIGQGTSVSP